MIRFIQSVPNVIERLIANITSPGVQDILIRIITAETDGGIPGVIEWLHDEALIPRLITFLSPSYPSSMHIIASDLLNSILSLCGPTPFNSHGGNADQHAGQSVRPPGTLNPRLLRDLASRASVSTLLGYMLDDIEMAETIPTESPGYDSFSSDPFVNQPLPSISSASSSLSHVSNILVELVRRNNSDYSEPHLFHALRNRLMNVRMQQPAASSGEAAEEDERKRMEEALEELSPRLGIVHLGNLLDIIIERFERLHHFISHPRSQARAASVSMPKPLTSERFRIVELYAELLHSSNMSIVNRPAGTGPKYTEDGILIGGLAGLEALGEAIDGDRAAEGDENAEPEDEVKQARELPVSSASTDASLDSESVASEDEKMLEDIDDESTTPAGSTVLPDPDSAALDAGIPPPPPPPSHADVVRLRDVRDADTSISRAALSDIDSASVSHAAVAASTAAPSVASIDLQEREERDGARETTPKEDSMVLGDKLKSVYIQHRVLPALVDLFFEYPANNFLHHVVYDLLQQVLNGRLGPGLNRELAIELIREAKLIERILDAQRLNDRLV